MVLLHTVSIYQPDVPSGLFLSHSTLFFIQWSGGIGYETSDDIKSDIVTTEDPDNIRSDTVHETKDHHGGNY
jgi:hypothetical protein